MFFSAKQLAVSVVICACTFTSLAQSTPQANWNLDKINTVTTSLPFLRIINDTRSGGMADVGIAISPDANGAQLNGAKMAFIDKDFGFGISFTPWLKQLVNDIYLTQATGYYRIKKQQTIHASFRYFSLGSIQFTNDQGDPTIQVRPNELAADFGYSRKLGKIFSVGLTLRFAFSNIAPGGIPGPGGEVVRPALAGAADISWMLDKTFTPAKGNMTHELKVGMNISNLGNKVTYSANTYKDFIPANLGIGVGYVLNVDMNNSVGLYADFNKLLVPTPIPRELFFDNVTKKVKPQYDLNADNIPDYRQWGTLEALGKSFGDAPGGAIEELREISAGVGLEYWFKKMFSVRTGYFYEHPTKGNRQFVSLGASVKYSIAGLHLSYLVPTTNQRNPLDNTFRLSLTFDFVKGNTGKKSAAPVGDTPDAEPTAVPRKERVTKPGEPAGNNGKGDIENLPKKE